MPGWGMPPVWAAGVNKEGTTVSDMMPLLPEEQILSVTDLQVSFLHHKQLIPVVQPLSFTLNRRETLAIVGESGAGKSVLAMALMQLLARRGGRVESGPLWLRRRNRQVVDLRQLTSAQWRAVRGADMAMIFQNPMTSLNPVFTVGEQIIESIRLHQHLNCRDAALEAKHMLDLVRIPQGRQIMSLYPHQVSVGMHQRVMIASALSCRPAVLIADEPTAMLDVTIQAQILQLIRVLQQEMDTGVIFITRDMSVAAEVADRVLVMSAGASVESGSARSLFAQPQHAVTRALLAAAPRFGALQNEPLPHAFSTDPASSSSLSAPQNTVHYNVDPILSVRDLVVRYPVRTGVFSRLTHQVHAVERVSFDIWPGETLALVGESGCGKSTLGKALVHLMPALGGTISLNRQPTFSCAGQQRQGIQALFQNMDAPLDPRMTIGESVMEPLLMRYKGNKARSADEAMALLSRVEIDPGHAAWYPQQFSAGEQVRICIARALALAPDVIIADEPLAALDMSVRAKLVNLMMALQRERGVAFLFISHDMAMVERISHRVAVMYLGQIVEIGHRQAVFNNPQHPYTRRLLAAVLVADPMHRGRQRILLSDEPPSATRRKGDEPFIAPLLEVAPGHFVARHPITGADV